jgi:hypothetical protein
MGAGSLWSSLGTYIIGFLLCQSIVNIHTILKNPLTVSTGQGSCANLYCAFSILVGTRDGRTQSARAWLSGPEFQDLDKRTLGFRTSIDGQLGSGFQDLDRRTDGDLSVKIVGTRDGRTQSARAWLSGPEFQDLEKRTLGFRTSRNGHWVSGPRQTDSWDLGFKTSKQSAKQKSRGRRGSHLSSFLKKTRSCVRPSVRPSGPVPP